ncbi:MAG: stage V sporulation protein AC [Clostridia bacterium]|nr:stage V sporulation protein AC [Clostridia bacterium]
MKIMTNREYLNMVKKASPNSSVVKDCINAFWVGGLICVLGQALNDLYIYLGLETTKASSAVSITLVGISIILTAMNIYQKIASFAGAGTLVPITGFANAMSSPSIEFKAEGQVLGIGSKMFSIAGSVIIYGLLASWVYGVVYLVTTLF